MRRCISLTFVCLWVFPVLAQDRPSARHLDALQGTWQCVSSETKGEARPFDVVQRLKLVISGKDVTWYGDGKEYLKATIVFLDAGASPREITMQFSFPDDAKGKQAPLIYSLTGNILVTCGHIDGRRPNEFSTTSEKGSLHLDVWRKVN